jgi:class 3 adenylate cyclase
VELIALGDTVNTAARLDPEPAADEVLVSASEATTAGLAHRLERRSLQLKGKEAPTAVVVLRV